MNLGACPMSLPRCGITSEVPGKALFGSDNPGLLTVLHIRSVSGHMPNGGLLCYLRVADVRVGDPYRFGLVVDAIPYPPTCGDLVLPLLHVGSVH